MNPPQLVFLDASTLDRNDLDLAPLHRLGKVTLHSTTSRDQTAARLAEADIALTNKADMDAATLEKAPRLRFIAVCATGTNNVDLVAAKKRGIRVANASGYGTASVAQHALAFILNWATQVARYGREPEAWARSPIFTRLDYPVRELAGQTLGLVGTGRIGSQLGQFAEALGMQVLAWGRDGASTPGKSDPWPRLPLRELFSQSDIISLHCPLTEQTRHLINRESLGWMKRDAFLVNTGRGDLIDEPALVEALRDGRIGGAGLDVLSVEPPPANHPLLQLQHPNLTLTPHSAWTAQEALERLLHEVVLNIEAFLRGEDRNCVA